MFYLKKIEVAKIYLWGVGSGEWMGGWVEDDELIYLQQSLLAEFLVFTCGILVFVKIHPLQYLSIHPFAFPLSPFPFPLSPFPFSNSRRVFPVAW
jgi:hypothetical protein